jgi:thiamine pyrophosphate-dependent acetolactate synthase large subunit-like protein
MVGLGLAMAQPTRPVLVLTGDGEMLMGLGSLATIAVKAPANLTIAVLDNEHYGETGNQPTHTGAGVDLAAVAGACGFPQALTCRTDAEVIDLKRRLQAANGATFAAIKVANRKDPLVLPPRDGAFLKHRFRTELLGRSA